MSIFTAAMRPLVSRVVHSELRSADYLRLDDRTIGRIVRNGWIRFGEAARTLPEEPTPGAQLNVRFAALTLAIYRSMLAEGVSPSVARNWVAGAVWRVYRWWGLVPNLIARSASRDPLRRLRICTDLFRRFPFNPPGYIMVDITDEESVAFDVRRCPVAEYFLREREGAVCQETWCDQDFPLARMWGGRLERTMTIAGGCTHCDFRWKAGGAGSNG